MSEKSVNNQATLAERLLKEMRDTHSAVSIYLVSGFQMKGEIVEFDEEAILLKLKDAHQLVMRSAVASMYPVRDSEDWWLNYTSEPSLTQ